MHLHELQLKRRMGFEEYSIRKSIVLSVLLLTGCSMAGNSGKLTEDDLSGETLARFETFRYSAKTSPTPTTTTQNQKPITQAEASQPVQVEEKNTVVDEMCGEDVSVRGSIYLNGELRPDLAEYRISDSKRMGELPQETQTFLLESINPRIRTMRVPVEHDLSFCVKEGSNELVGVIQDAGQYYSLASGSQLIIRNGEIQLSIHLVRQNIPFQELDPELRSFTIKDSPIFRQGELYTKDVRIELSGLVSNSQATGTYRVVRMNGENNPTLNTFFEKGGRIVGLVAGPGKFEFLGEHRSPLPPVAQKETTPDPQPENPTVIIRPSKPTPVPKAEARAEANAEAPVVAPKPVPPSKPVVSVPEKPKKPQPVAKKKQPKDMNRVLLASLRPPPPAQLEMEEQELSAFAREPVDITQVEG